MGIGYIVHHRLSKGIMDMSGEESMHACEKAQLFGSLAIGIEGGIHTMSLVWIQHSSE